MKRKKVIRILCGFLAGILLLAGAVILIVADRGLLGAYHPLKTPKSGQITPKSGPKKLALKLSKKSGPQKAD